MREGFQLTVDILRVAVLVLTKELHSQRTNLNPCANHYTSAYPMCLRKSQLGEPRDGRISQVKAA